MNNTGQKLQHNTAVDFLLVRLIGPLFIAPDNSNPNELAVSVSVDHIHNSKHGTGVVILRGIHSFGHSNVKERMYHGWIHQHLIREIIVVINQVVAEEQVHEQRFQNVATQ